MFFYGFSVLTSRICLAAEAAGVEGVADAARSYGLPTVTATDGGKSSR